MAAHHYLHDPQPVGEHVKCSGFAGANPIAAMAWASAPRHLAGRDPFIGWPPPGRRRHLHLIADNTRFLILPWVKVRYLASQLLGRVARQMPSGCPYRIRRSKQASRVRRVAKANCIGNPKWPRPSASKRTRP
jgi:hypothetical protein